MPFVKLAYVSKNGSARPSGAISEDIQHFGAIRMRLNGSGSLKMTFYSLNDVNSMDLIPFTMQASTNIQPTRLTNFNEQRASLRISTTEIDEVFRINRIILFGKDLWTSYPGTS